MEVLYETIYQFVVVIAIFLVLTIICSFVYDKIKDNYLSTIDVNELLPEDEVHSLRQVFYLIMMALCIVIIFYSFMGEGMEFYNSFPILDIALSLYFAIKLDKSSVKNKVLWLLLVPYGSLCFLLFNHYLVFYMHALHVLVFIYFAKRCLDKFMEYTNSNGLGITIVVLFLIIFLSFFITQYAEGVNAVDSLVMISNEFTGNGYGIFGKTIAGKLNSLLLVWGGYVISGVGASTLTAAILVKHFNKRFKELERLIEGDDE